MKKALSIVIACLLVVSMFAGCGNGSATPSSAPEATDVPETAQGSSNLTVGEISDYGVHKVGFANDDASSDFGATLTQVLQDYCNKIGWELVTADAQCNAANQCTQVENMLTSGCEAIIVKPYDESACGPISTACQEAGVPLLTITSPINTHYDACIGAIASETGKFVGNYIVDTYGTDAKVAYLRCTLASQLFVERYDGFVSALEENGMSLVREECPEGRKDKAMTVMENWIMDGVDFDVIYADNSDMALGAYNVLEANGLEDQIPIVTSGGERTDMVAIKEGKIAAAWDGNSQLLASAAMDAIVILLNGGTFSGFVAAPDHMITIDDVDQYMEQYGYEY